MSVSTLLLPELVQELKVTRTLLERVPIKPDFLPHPKSMALGKLAAHVAQLPDFGMTVVTMPELDFLTAKFTPLPFESPEQLIGALEEGGARLQAAVKNVSDAGWSESWRLAMGEKTIFQGERFLAYREMFLNHLVHHRAQLGVYLRMNDVPLPSTYGPSADDRMGF